MNADIFGVSVGFDTDATFGGGYSETRTKSREASRSFNLEVLCNPPNSMQAYDPNGNGLYDAERRLLPHADQVTQYLTLYYGIQT